MRPCPWESEDGSRQSKNTSQKRENSRQDPAPRPPGCVHQLYVPLGIFWASPFPAATCPQVPMAYRSSLTACFRLRSEMAQRKPPNTCRHTGHHNPQRVVLTHFLSFPWGLMSLVTQSRGQVASTSLGGIPCFLSTCIPLPVPLDPKTLPLRLCFSGAQPETQG